MFWADYPKKDGKKGSKQKFTRIIKSGVDFDDIMVGLSKYKVCEKVRKGFVKNPEVWLNGEHWNDENTAPMNGSSSQADMYRNMK